MYRLFLLAFAAMIATPLQSQDTLLAQLRGRRDSVLLAWREAQTLADLADSLERERATAGADTIAVGGLLIIANRSPLPLRAAAERAWPVVDSLYGPLAAELTQHPFIIRAVDPDTAVRRAVLHVGVELPWDLDIATTTAVLLTTVTPPRADRALDEWLGGPLRPTSLPDDERRAVFVQLVTAPSEAVRRCFLGDITRCRDVLQLSDSGDLVERWYVTPAEREVLVTRWSSYFERGATAASLQRCRQHHDDACTALLRSLPLATLPPLARIARLTLLREALHAGDDGRRQAVEEGGRAGQTDGQGVEHDRALEHADGREQGGDHPHDRSHPVDRDAEQGGPVGVLGRRLDRLAEVRELEEGTQAHGDGHHEDDRE